MTKINAKINAKKIYAFKNKAFKIKIQNRHLFKRNTKNVPLRQIIDDLI